MATGRMYEDVVIFFLCKIVIIFEIAVKRHTSEKFIVTLALITRIGDFEVLKIYFVFFLATDQTY